MLMKLAFKASAGNVAENVNRKKRMTDREAERKREVDRECYVEADSESSFLA